MTELLYQTDSYLKEFTAKVIKTNTEKNAIILAQTAFYPGGGGQPCDSGFIKFDNQSSQIIKIKKEDNLYWHYVEGKLPEEKSEITGIIDWDKRYQLMRTHSAMHVLCGVIWRDYQAQVTGGNMEPLSGRMDFEFEQMKGELVAEIEAKVNEEIKKNHSIQVKILPREEANAIPDLIRTKINLLPASLTEIRTVEIINLDLQADGGTHVANTSEIGRIKVADYKSKGKINKRIKIQILDV
ncbi:MAG: alanyl-tRNA editing protein [Spirochaetes bacterium]|nr:alanyl-tRNA editing protein [Spirochaetota bacterium]